MAPHGAIFAFALLHQRHINTKPEKSHSHEFGSIQQHSWLDILLKLSLCTVRFV